MRRALTAFARRFTLMAALALMLSGAALAFSAPPALADGATGVIAGVLTNGTRSTPVAGQQVTLQLTLGSSVKNLATTTTSASGGFTFTDVDASPADLGGQWAVFTTYQGGLYSSAAVTAAAGKAVDASFTVYDATQSDASLSVDSVTVLVRSVDALHGLVSVGEIVSVRDSGKTAFVGLPPSGSATTMLALLRFAVPSNAINLSTGAGFYNTQIIQVDAGFAATATVPPGVTEFAFAYQLPYTGTTLAIPFKAVYPTAQVTALVPPGMLAHDAAGFSGQGIVTAFGARYQVYSASNLPHDGQVTLSLFDLPRAGQRAYLNATALLWLAGIIAALLALLAALYVWRGALGAALGLAPAPGPTADAQTVAAILDAKAVEAERQRLLREILDLERRHKGGDVSDERFARENAALRQRLRDLLASSPDNAVQPEQAAAAKTAGSATSVDAGAPAATPGGRGGAR